MKYVMLFPGQGSQYLQMCHQLYEKSAKTRKIFEIASQILGYDLWDIIENGDMKRLTKSRNAQPAVLAASFSLYQHFIKTYEKKPEVVIGHSLGEISALVCSGSIPFEEAISFVGKRGELMEEAFLKKLGFPGGIRYTIKIKKQQLCGVLLEIPVRSAPDSQRRTIAYESYNQNGKIPGPGKRLSDPGPKQK